MSLPAIPPDVLMEVFRELDLSDSLHLIATNTTFRPILHSRYFWITALNRFEQFHRRPLPCSPGLEISSLPLATLKELAIHAYKLKKNWSSESPSPVSVRIIEMDDFPRRIVPIQGTRLIITLSSFRIACWDTDSAQCVGTFDHEMEPIGMEDTTSIEFYPLVRPGSCSIGFIYSSSSTNAWELAIISFEYQHSSAVNISKVFSKIWTLPKPEEYTVSDVLVSENIFAAMIVEPEAEASFLLVCGREDAAIRIIDLGPNAATWPRCIIMKDDFYVTQQYTDTPTADIFHIQTSTTETRDLSPRIKKTSISIPSSTADVMQVASLSFCHLRVPKYGVLNMTLKSTYTGDEDEPEKAFHTLHLWPAEHDGSTLTVASLHLYEHPRDIISLSVGSSATCGIVSDENTLGLVQYLPHQTPQVQFTALDIPDIDIDFARTIALDDSLGALYIACLMPDTGEYHLSAIAYA